MKRFIGFFFISLCICALFSASFFIDLQQKNIKKEGREVLKTNKFFVSKDLSIIDFNKAKLNQYELKLDGKFYEYKIICKNAKSIKLFVRYDVKESKFEKWKNKQNKSSKKNAKKIGIQLFVNTVKDKSFTFNLENKKQLIGYLFSKIETLRTVIIAPPQLRIL